MDLQTFANIVRVMREAQTDYFKSKTYKNLQRAKALEKRVDTELQKIPKPNTPTQTNFF